MGWQKKSSGNCYDSQSGHSYAIGLYRRKIIDSCTYCKVCKICDQARIKNLTPQKHHCAKNCQELGGALQINRVLHNFGNLRTSSLMPSSVTMTPSCVRIWNTRKQTWNLIKESLRLVLHAKWHSSMKISMH